MNMRRMTSQMIPYCLVMAFPAAAFDLHVSPSGTDTNPGTRERPVASLSRARDLVRSSEARGRESITVHVAPGIYYLPEPLLFGGGDSGMPAAPITYQADGAGDAVLSGGRRLELSWTRSSNGICVARAPVAAGDLAYDQFFVNGVRQPMARYPNFDRTIAIYNGFAADAFGPARAARWANPAGGYIHAMHSAHWGGYHYRITGKSDTDAVTFEGGWQNNRQMGMHPQHRFVENIREELDTQGEWFHDAPAGLLYFYPPPPLASQAALSTSVFEVVRLRELVGFRGTREQPVRNITLAGFTFRHAARTFMDTREPLLRSDWTIYRGGSVCFDGAEDCGITDSVFDQVGGNALFVNNYNRRIRIRGCLISDAGGSGVAFVGDPKAVRNPLFEYKQRLKYADLDLTPGPVGDNFPADCAVEDCLIRRTGRVEKQSAGVQISMSQSISVRQCSIYETPRAGINISEGTWGGHLIEFCDVFDTVLETGDHGSFNSWGRDRFWQVPDVPAGKLPSLALLDVVKPIVIRNNRWRCDHGWDVDLDDGSSNYEIYNNLLLNGGLKLREGFHRRVWNNITVNNSLHPHVWYPDCGDEVYANLFMGSYRPAGGMPKGKWGSKVDGNFFAASETDRTRFSEHDCDANSISGDPLFLDPSEGDYRVRDESPVLKTGFRNFPMDRFGVQKPDLKAMVRMPDFPALVIRSKGAPPDAPMAVPACWDGCLLRDLVGEEYSAYGVSKDSGGVRLAQVPADSPLARAGLQTEDLLQEVNGRPVRNTQELLTALSAPGPLRLGYVRGQQHRVAELRDCVVVEHDASSTGRFSRLNPAGASERLQISALATQPAVNNEPVACLRDGMVARNYGPVFANGTKVGFYRVDLGRVTDVADVLTWSFRQNGQRGTQRFTLYGSATSGDDAGWDPTKGGYVPLVSVRCEAREDFLATRVSRLGGSPLGRFRWLLWQVEPVSPLGEHTAFQEFQIRAGAGSH